MIDNDRAYKAVADTLTKSLPPKAINNAMDILSSIDVPS